VVLVALSKRGLQLLRVVPEAIDNLVKEHDPGLDVHDFIVFRVCFCHIFPVRVLFHMCEELLLLQQKIRSNMVEQATHGLQELDQVFVELQAGVEVDRHAEELGEDVV